MSSAAAPAFADLRARLDAVSISDAHRLGRKLESLRRHRGDGKRAAALERQLAGAEARLARRASAVPGITYPEQLPVAERREELMAAIAAHQVVVVAGETGSGKTTQIPKMCLELGRGVRGMIGHTQPRRLAARTVAERIADELRVPLGEAVGYAVRFSDRSREDTLVRLMTDGLLLAEIRRDRLLRRYDTIIVDEAHERSLNIDFLLGYIHRILPRRPDLKLIITSATIDPGRFAAHFGDAPVVEVSGRTYPVEVRYRPLSVEAPGGDPKAPPIERDQAEAIADAVDELAREPAGDVLVFLSGESEIRDTAEVLRGRLGDRVEVLPLYARLSTPEQQRVFRPHEGRRVVLATNVAETSLTVPGIRYVVDAGLARISRYSARLKVQRLPIEPVSQASAAQRTGRCGRLSDGICIRLYAEEDFLERPAFTDPEILRTNLASVILQMAALGLGAVEDFPFLDPPDRRQVRDGVNLLHELGAIDPQERDPAKQLTQVGRKLAELPVDPRLARMVLEAERLGCADELVVIAAALSIQDPRERPQEERAQADQQHARFRDEHSDFIAYLNLWRYLREQQRELSGSAFRRRCKAEYLHYLRIREWQDLVAQLRSAAKAVGVHRNQEPAEPREIHQALLSGLLSHVGLRDAAKREYQGARGARFAVFPGSVLARKQPAWVMVAELVETSRLWGRTAARIEPAWIEPLAGHLVRRTYDEPRWDPKRGAVVATERVLLYGLPIVAGRTVAYGRIDPAVARELFIRRALVEGEWEREHAFLARNQELVEEVARLEDRVRRRGLLVEDQVLFDFYAARIPEDVVSGAHFERWWRDARRADPDLLTFPRELLVRPDAADALDPKARPAKWRQGDLLLDLSYRFEPGSEGDGVTVHVPLGVLPQLEETGFDWLVPALREELVTQLLRMLPKELRRRLVPVPEVAAQVLAAVTPRREPVVVAVAAALERLRGVRIPPETWDLRRLPAHLRMTYRVEGEQGEVLAEGLDLDAVRAAVRPRLRAELAAATTGLERHGAVAWEFGTLPREVTLPGTGGAVRAYPALVDEGSAVGVAVLEGPAAQAAAMAAGTRRLLLLTVPSPVKHIQSRLGRGAQLALSAPPHGSTGLLLADVIAATVDRLVAQAGGPAWDAAGFERLRRDIAAKLPDAAVRVMQVVVSILDAARSVRAALEPLRADAVADVRRDVEAQFDRLLPAGFVSWAGVRRLPDLERYLRAAVRRLERFPDAPGVDRDRMAAVHALEAEHAARLAAWPVDRPLPEELAEVPWMLEELRVAQFAQGLGTRGPVSAKRIRRALEAAA
jgi:ATP-dependent helicase HrpA